MKGTTVGQTTCCLLKAKSVFYLLHSKVKHEACLFIAATHFQPDLSLRTLDSLDIFDSLSLKEFMVLHSLYTGKGWSVKWDSLNLHSWSITVWNGHDYSVLSAFLGRGVSNTPNQCFVSRILRHLLTTPALLRIALGMHILLRESAQSHSVLHSQIRLKCEMYFSLPRGLEDGKRAKTGNCKKLSPKNRSEA